ncbi:hypothetical protein CWO92_24790 [Heyndrickxia camelliae]|uniref:Nudix hydrolase domain-containing protein n=1 Tax=Heyndrickxia camelliae TaxID=1707093 RepID=A0A2N3LCQ0_9BACI|nr:hypothetical protein CWO92_24790 [Heyndrickxia camelliae]
MGMSDYYQDLREKVGSELIFMPSVAAIIRNKAGEILFQHKGNGEKWSLPAGAIELGEAPAEAVVREVWEETGLHVVPKKLVGVFGGKDFRYQYPNGHKVEYNVFLFECVAQGGELNPIDSETAELRYFKAEEMPELALPYPKFLFLQDNHAETYFQRKESGDIYNEAIKNLTNLTHYWPGFEAVSFAFYDKEKVHLYRHPDFKEEVFAWNEQFMADTLILYENYPTAIMNLERYADEEGLFSILAHELFHGYQYLKGEDRFPNEMLGISYPLKEENIELRNQERFHLYQALVATSVEDKRKSLQAFISIREKRASIIEEFIQYETNIETVEGPAWYIELKAYAERSLLPYEAVLEKYSRSLLDKHDSSLNIRKSCYSAGLVLCLLLDELYPDWKHGFFESNHTLYDLLKKHVDYTIQQINEISISNETKTILKMVKNSKDAEFTKFETKKGYHLVLEGNMIAALMDPMNIVKSGNKLLHKNFLKIRVGEKEYLFQQPVVAYKNDNSRGISKIHTILEEEPIEKDSSFILNGVGEFDGSLYTKDGTFFAKLLEIIK